MKKIKLNDLVNLLDESEFIKLGLLINSPFFKVPARLINLYAYLKKNYKSIKSGKINRDEAAKRILGNRYSSTALRKLYSDFVSEIYRFMTMIEFEEDSCTRSLFLLKRFKTKNKDDLFKAKLKEVRKKFESITDNELRSKMLSELYWEEYNSEPESVFHKYSTALQNASDSLDEYYISRKLFYFQLMFSKQYMNREDIGYRWQMSGEIIYFIEKNSDYVKESLPEVYLKFLMIKMLDFKSDYLISEYSDFIENNSSRFAKAKIVDYYSDLYNYFTIRIGRGEVHFRHNLINLVKILDKKNILVDETSGKITYYSFKTITDTCIFLKDLDWMEYFISKYKKMLDDINKTNITNLAYAKLNYYLKEYQNSRIYLAKVSYKDYIHYLDAKSLQAIIEYDSKNFIELYLIIDSIKKYIKTHKEIPANVTEAYRRFMDYLMRLVRILENKCEHPVSEIELTGNELNRNSEPLYARSWLDDKVKELEIIFNSKG